MAKVKRTRVADAVRRFIKADELKSRLDSATAGDLSAVERLLEKRRGGVRNPGAGRLYVDQYSDPIVRAIKLEMQRLSAAHARQSGAMTAIKRLLIADDGNPLALEFRAKAGAARTDPAVLKSWVNKFFKVYDADRNRG